MTSLHKLFNNDINTILRSINSKTTVHIGPFNKSTFLDESDIYNCVGFAAIMSDENYNLYLFLSHIWDDGSYGDEIESGVNEIAKYLKSKGLYFVATLSANRRDSIVMLSSLLSLNKGGSIGLTRKSIEYRRIEIATTMYGIEITGSEDDTKSTYTWTEVLSDPRRTFL